MCTISLLFADAGVMLHSPEQPAQWAPPPAANKITLLPDLFYTAYPETLPTSAEAMPAEGLSIEMGALHPHIYTLLCDAEQFRSQDSARVCNDIVSNDVLQQPSVNHAVSVTCAAGGLVSDTVFRRTVVSYGGNGRLASIRHDDFSRA